MGNEIVKYHNDLNSLNTRNWNAVEMDIFFSIIAKLKNKNTEVVELEKEELIRLCNYAGKSNDRFVKVLFELIDHVSHLKYKKYDKKDGKNKLTVMNLFELFEFEWSDDFSELKGKVKVSQAFSYILNNFDIGFTTFELEEFTKFRSTYSKSLYRQLKQYKKCGKREFSIEEFRYLLSIPKSYKSSDIDKRVLKLIIKELSQCFMDLKVKPIKKRTKGSPIIAYRFTWTPERTNKWIEGKPQSNPNKQKKKVNKEKQLPGWYADTEQTKADEELLKHAHELQERILK